MEKFEIYSPFDCVIVSQSSQTFLSSNEHLCLSSCDKMFVYPVGKTQNYSFVLDANSSSPFYRTIKKDNKTFIFFLDGVLSEKYEIFTFSSPKPCNVKVGCGKVVFACEKTERQVNLPRDIVSYTCDKFDHIVYCICKCEDKDYMVAFNTKNKNIKTFSGDEISFNDNLFKISNHNNESTIALDKEGLVLKESSISKQNFIAIDLFNALKSSSYEEGYKMLSQSLQENLPLKDFKEYFGKISYFFPINESQVFALSNNKEKIYNLTVTNGQITDMDDE